MIRNLENGFSFQKEKEKFFSQALVIGRFQPPCYHHFEMFKDVIQKSGCKKFFLGLGISVLPDAKNFLSFDERKDMITPVLSQLGVEFEIKPVPDINNSSEYGRHVQSIFTEINENNTQIFTENPYTKDCFVNYGHNFQVVSPAILPNKATNVRELMVSGGDWEKYVFPCVSEYLKEHNLISRLKDLSEFQPRISV